MLMKRQKKMGMNKTNQIKLKCTNHVENSREYTKNTRKDKNFDSYTVFEAPLPRTSLYCNNQERIQNIFFIWIELIALLFIS